MQELRDHNETIKENEAFKSYASPIERTSWVRKGAAFFHSGEPRTKFESCNVELEQTGSPQGGIDFGTLSIFGSSKRSKVGGVNAEKLDVAMIDFDPGLGGGQEIAEIKAEL